VASIDQAGTSAQSGQISVTTGALGTPIVQLFQHCSFGGWAASFTGTGNFNTADIVSRGGLDNDASSIKIAAGFRVTLFDGNQQGGASVVLTAGDTTCFTAANINFNDRLSSLRIETATSPSPSPSPSPGGGTARSAPYMDISSESARRSRPTPRRPGCRASRSRSWSTAAAPRSGAAGSATLSNAMFPNGTTVKSAIDSMVGAGRKVIIAWGGANGSALSSCGSASQAQAMYQSVFNAYPNITGQDFDIEGGVNTTILAPGAGRAEGGESQQVHLGDPARPAHGPRGRRPRRRERLPCAGFHPDTVNVMAMDYGSANDNGGNMLLSAQQAAQATRNQTGDMIGITPMIGINDTNTEFFTLANATDLVNWAKGQSYINRLAFWSLARDNGSCPNQGFASPVCSGIAQSTGSSRDLQGLLVGAPTGHVRAASTWRPPFSPA
jgi:hypothetical protein